jgi:hypothetical protein
MARIAKTLKNDLSTLKQSCVGKKMKGFKFADCKSASWVPTLQDFIGQEGEIIAYNEAWNYFTVKFPKTKGHWAYPATKALKHIVEEPKVSDEDLVIVQKIVDDTYVAMLKEDIEDLSARLDSAYKEQEEMIKELERQVESIKFNSLMIEEHAGTLTISDVAYSLNLLLKIMKNKFGHKPTEE